VPRRYERKKSYQWVPFAGLVNNLTGTGGTLLGGPVVMPPLEGKIVRWTGSVGFHNREPVGGDQYTAFVGAIVVSDEISAADLQQIFNDLGTQPVTWQQTTQKTDDFPVVVPIAIPPQHTNIIQFDQRAKRRWHRGDIVQWGLYHAQPGASDEGMNVVVNTRILLEFD